MPNCTILQENLWLSHTIYERPWYIKALSILMLGIRKTLESIGVNLYAVYNTIGGRQIHSKDYDAVIGFDETLVNYVSKIPAKRRINWIHCDYRRYANGHDEKAYYDKIDAVVCVSEFVKGVFTEVYPQYAEKVHAIHNVINVEDILLKSKAEIDDQRFMTDDYTIVSCGRLDPVKQFSLIPEIAYKLKTVGVKPFKWYIIGGGNEKEEKKIREKIEQFNMQDVVVMLGMKTNVYPYLSNSDLYVCTSSSESFPMVINEAKALSIPVVSNNFPSAVESVREGIDGLICAVDKMPEVIGRQMHIPLVIDKNSYQSENNKIIQQLSALI